MYLILDTLFDISQTCQLECVYKKAFPSEKKIRIRLPKLRIERNFIAQWPVDLDEG